MIELIIEAVNDLKRIGGDSDGVNNLAKCGISGCLGHAAPIDSTHRIIRVVLGVTFDGTLHCDTPIKDMRKR